MADLSQIQIINFALSFEVLYAGVLSFLAGVSYRRTGNPKLGWITVAFSMFFLKALLLTLGLYGLFPAKPDIYGVLLDVVILFVMYVGVVKG